MSAVLTYQTRTKTPTEAVAFVFSYEEFPEIVGGETLVSAVVTGPGGAALSGISATSPTVTTQDEVVDSAGTKVLSGKGFLSTISGGTAGTDYIVECLATFSGGAERAVQGKVSVQNAV